MKVKMPFQLIQSEFVPNSSSYYITCEHGHDNCVSATSPWCEVNKSCFSLCFIFCQKKGSDFKREEKYFFTYMPSEPRFQRPWGSMCPYAEWAFQVHWSWWPPRRKTHLLPAFQAGKSLFLDKKILWRTEWYHPGSHPMQEPITG